MRDSQLSTPPDDNLIKLSEFFVLVLLGVAYEATIDPIHHALQCNEHLSGTGLLLFTFIITTFRFLVGNFRHLRSDAWNTQPRSLLLYDMFCIGLESVMMIFLGRLTSVESNLEGNKGHADYLCLMIVLFALDAIWIFSQYFCGLVQIRLFALLSWLRISQSDRVNKPDPLKKEEQVKYQGWHRSPADIPWHWLFINLALVIILGSLKCFASDVLSERVLLIVAGINFVAFFVDILGIDTKERMKERNKRHLEQFQRKSEQV